MSELLGVQGVSRGREWGLWSVEYVQVQGSRVPGLFLVFVPLIVCTYRTGLESYSASPRSEISGNSSAGAFTQVSSLRFWYL